MRTIVTWLHVDRPLSRVSVAAVRRSLCLLACLVAATAAWAAEPAGYYDPASGLSGAPLKSALHDIVDQHTIIPYSSLDAPLRELWEDPSSSANILLIYSGIPVAKTALTWNREHLWPRSRGNSDHAGPDDSDLHHVVPCDEDVNSQRANLAFDTSSAVDGGVISPAHAEAPQCTRDSNSWQPRTSERGDIARALFYMAMRYDGAEAATTDLELVAGAPSGPQMANLNTLLSWHASDPPDAAERMRNDRIFTAYQQNRNPFIDHPEWVQEIWGGPPAQLTAQAVASDASATESPSAPTTFVIQLSQSAGAGGLTVQFQTGGQAQPGEYALTGAGVNFSAASGAGSVMIASGASSATLTLTPLADGLAEPAETVTLTIVNGSGYSPAGAAAQVTIHDAPTPPPTGTIASWHFDAESFPDPLPANLGTGTIRFGGWWGSVDSFAGVSGKALALVGAVSNGRHIDLVFSATGHHGVVLTFSTRGSATGFDVGTWSWSTDGTAFTTLAGINTASRASAFEGRTVDFSAVTALTNAPAVTLRYTLSGCTSDLGNNRLDNLAIRATPLPYSAAWLGRFPALIGALADPSVDVESDGETNFAEFAFDMHPLEADPQLLPIVGSQLLLDPASGGAPKPFTTIEFTRRTDAPWLTYTPQSSLDLVAWAANLIFISARAGATPETERATFRAPFSQSQTGGPTSLFLRVRVTQQP